MQFTPQLDIYEETRFHVSVTCVMLHVKQMRYAPAIDRKRKYEYKQRYQAVH